MDDLGTIIQKDTASAVSLNRLLIGLVLLIPGIILYFHVQLIPALNTWQMSRTDFNILRPAEFVGMENYTRLSDDPALGSAIGYTLSIIVLRLLIVAIVPPLVGLLVGAQGRAGRSFNRLLLTVPVVLASPVVIAVLWSAFLSPLWGRQPSPLYPLSESWMLGSVTGAQNSLRVADAVITLAIAAAVGGAAYMAVLRGRSVSLSAGRAGIGVWLIGLLLVVGSVPLTFDLPYIVTAGGPMNSTTTLPLALYQRAFRNFQFGYAAAQGVLWIAPMVIAAFLIWVVITAFQLRLSFTPPARPSETAGVLSFLSSPLLVVMALPLVGLVLWGVWLSASGGTSDSDAMINVRKALTNTIQGPWLAIWLVQIPVTYLVGLALGFIRPINRMAANVIFLFFLMMAFLPAEVLSLQWFEMARNSEALNTPLIPGFGALVSAFSLVVFKLFFDGAYEKFEAAKQTGQPTTDAFLNAVFLPSLPIVLVVGGVLCFASAQALWWPLIVNNERDLYGFPVLLVLLRSQFMTDSALIARNTVTYAGILAVVFWPAFALLQVLVLDRLAILAGPPVDFTPEMDKPKRDSIGFE